VSLLPSYATAAALHQRSDTVTYAADVTRSALANVEHIAASDYLAGLANGGQDAGWIRSSSRLMGLDKGTLERWNGRVPPVRFAKAAVVTNNAKLGHPNG
jgi:hypothetical protein